VQIFGADAATLKAAAEAVKTALASIPRGVGARGFHGLRQGGAEPRADPAGRGAGLSIDDLGRALRNRLGGIEAATFPDGPRTASIRVELPDGALTADFLDRTLMRTARATTCRWPTS
jgi:Cu/Ag efflux pump CusA